MAINFDRVNPKNLSGRQKVAAILISMGQDASAELMRHFSEREIEMVTLEMLRMQRVPSRVLDSVQREFKDLLLADESLSMGGPDYAREVLRKAIGEERSQEMLDRVMAGSGTIPFDFFRVAEPTQLLNFIQNEHPQTIALILSHLKPVQAAAILQSLSPDLQSDVAKRVATMDRPSPDVIRQVEGALRERMASVIVEDVSEEIGGLDYLVKVINQVDRATEKSILEQLDESTPKLSDELRKAMFVFEDIVSLDDRSIQRVLKEVDSKDLVLAMRGASDEVKDTIFRNMSQRASDLLRDDLEVAGPVRLRNVEEAQQRIVNVIRKLEEAEEIVVARGGEDDVLV